MANKKVEVAKEKVPVSIPKVLAMLGEGKDRPAIGKELGLTRADINRLFKHKDLTGKKVKRPASELNGFVIVEELDGTVASTNGTASASISDGTVADVPIAAKEAAKAEW